MATLRQQYQWRDRKTHLIQQLILRSVQAVFALVMVVVLCLAALSITLTFDRLFN